MPHIILFVFNEFYIDLCITPVPNCKCDDTVGWDTNEKPPEDLQRMISTTPQMSVIYC